ncbi:MAG: cbb3-type cytochrome c oxidase subunit I, partial [Pseudomonadales bacterium]|nr:cbb3-type cytochrome c oxidase subunit I [Pseudomonadales bacterium]
MHVSENTKSKVPPSSQAPFAWLILGVFALLAAGIFSILLVASRTPAIQEFIPIIDFFHVALVIHVNLSVLIWFLSFTAVLWSLNSKPIKVLDYSALSLAGLGTLGIVLGPLIGTDKPLMNNYIPVLEHDWFYFSLSLFGAGILLSAIKTVLSPISPVPYFESSPLNRSVYASAWVCIAAFLALLVSYLNLPKTISSASYFEYLFWGGGHILQFSHTLLALVAWAWLLKISSGQRFNFSSRLTPLFIITIMPVLSVPLIYYRYDVLSTEHHLAFTALMKHGGLASLP